MRDEPKRQPLTLAEARERTPAVSAVEAMRQQLSLALFDAVKPQDVIDLAMKLKEQAMAGDLKAAKLYLELMLGKDRPPAPVAPPGDSALAKGMATALKEMAEATQDLVDEIRVGKHLAAERAKHAERLPALPNGQGEEG